MNSSLVSAAERLRAPALLSSSSLLGVDDLNGRGFSSRTASQPGRVRAQAGTQRVKAGTKSGTIRSKASSGASIRLLSRVEQLRLLSKAEKAGLLTAAENAGFSLSAIEKLGLLSKAEQIGALSAATDRNTPGALLTLALVLLIGGPLFVYYVPEDSTPLVVLQVLVALASVLGGSAAFAASNLVAELQKSD